MRSQSQCSHSSSGNRQDTRAAHAAGWPGGTATALVRGGRGPRAGEAVARNICSRGEAVCAAILHQSITLIPLLARTGAGLLRPSLGNS